MVIDKHSYWIGQLIWTYVAINYIIYYWNWSKLNDLTNYEINYLLLYELTISPYKLINNQ